MFTLKKLTPDEAAEAIKPFSSLQDVMGAIVKLPQSRQILVTDTAGRMKDIKDVLDRADGTGGDDFQMFTLHSISADDATNLIRELIKDAGGGLTLMKVNA